VANVRDELNEGSEVHLSRKVLLKAKARHRSIPVPAKPTTRATPVVVMTAAVVDVTAARAGNVDGRLQDQSALRRLNRPTKTEARYED